MTLSITAFLIGSFLILVLGFLVGCAYYSWETHYRFKKAGSKEIEVGLRFSPESPPEFFGLQAVNDLLVKGTRVLAVKEGAVLARKTGEDGTNVQMYFSGFTVKIEFADR
jgi:hypothetical protein